MQDNVRKCLHCDGTGEIRGNWWVVLCYQDETEHVGPFANVQEAQAEAQRLDRSPLQPHCYADWLPERHTEGK